MRLPTLSLLLPLLGAGCVAAGESSDSVGLSNSAGAGKADSVHGKRLEPIGTGEVVVEAGSSYRGELEVRTVGDVVLEVEGPRLVVPAGANQRVRIGVDTADFDPFTELKFLAFVSPAGASDWEMIGHS